MKSAGLFVVLWWLVWAVFQYLTLTSYGQQTMPAAADSVISNMMLAVICTGVAFTIRFYRPDPSKSLFILLGIIILSFLYVWLVTQIMHEIIADDVAYLNLLSSSFIPRFMVAFFMLSLAVTIGWIVYYNNEYREEKSRLAETSRLMKDAELTNLVQKIQPHFLFNTLNSVNALIQSNPEAARKMIQELSGFLRGSLSNNDEKNTTLSREIEQLKLYLEIEKVRFGDRLKTEFKIDEQTLNFPLPPLMLQPLVENAIKFGLYDTLGQVLITIHTRMESTYLLVIVTNPFDEQTSGSQPGTGFGLTSLKRRLNLLFNRNDLLVTNKENGTFTATLKIPQS